MRVKAGETKEWFFAIGKRVLLGEAIEAILIERRFQRLLGLAGDKVFHKLGNGVIQLNKSLFAGTGRGKPVPSTDLFAGSPHPGCFRRYGPIW